MNRKFNIDAEKPGIDEIRGMSDFEGALGQYRRSQKIKNLKVGSVAMIGVAAILAVVMLFSRPSETPTIQAEAPAIDIPTKGHATTSFETPSERFVINPSKKNCVITKEGVILVFEANSFETPDSTLELRYKPLTNPVAVANEGVSMCYDSATTKYDFETAGMFELSANSIDSRQSIPTTKGVEVYYPKREGKDDFNTYTYSRELRSWSFVEKTPELNSAEMCERTSIVFDNDDQLAQQRDSIRNEIGRNYKPYSLRNDNLQPPRKPNKDNYRFNFDIVPSEFPELSEFADVEFEVVDRRFSYSYFDKTWDAVKLNRSTRGNYTVQLKEGKKEIEFDVYPVYTGREFDKKYEQYVLDSSKKQEWETHLLDEIDRLEEELADLLSKSGGLSVREQNMALVTAALGDFEPSNMYYQINMPSLGICNLDSPIVLPKGVEIKAEFYMVQNDKKTRLSHVTLINLDKDQYFEFPHTRMDEFRFQPKHRNMLIAITPEGELAYATPEMFDVIDSKAGRHIFYLDVFPHYPSAEELTAIIEGNREGV